jgi:tetratricopeptide (TPR) repeat protein
MQITLRLMGRLHNSLSNQDKAEEYLRSALAIQVAGLGSGHPATAYTQIELAESLLAKGESEEALEHAAASDETLTAALSDSHELTMRARGIHGAALQATGDFKAAEKLLHSSYELFKADPNAHPSSIQLARARLYALYTAWARPDLARAFAIQSKKASEAPGDS